MTLRVDSAACADPAHALQPALKHIIVTAASSFLRSITYIRDEACSAAHQQLFVEANRIKPSSS